MTEAQLAGGKKMLTIGKAIKPSEEEIEQNARSRSSVLRVAERMAD
ncbi:MAG: 16S rRNA (cytosine(1402)-N(4))-methyltransferase [Plesiomonas shigelloides]